MSTLPNSKTSAASGQAAGQDSSGSDMSLKRILRYLAFLVAWGGVLFGSAHVHQIDMGYLSFLCGRWGCLAPTSSLLGIHLLWLSLIAGASLGITAIKPIALPKIRILLFGLGVLGTIGIPGRAVFLWSPESIGEFARLIPFSIISQTDVPAVQSILIGLTLGRFRKQPALSTAEVTAGHQSMPVDGLQANDSHA